MDTLDRISGRPGLVANLVLGAVLAGILTAEVALTPDHAGARVFGLSVGVLIGVAALFRARNRPAALAAGLVICAVADILSVTADLPSQPGIAATTALLVLGASYVRTASPRNGWLATLGGIAVLVAGRGGLRPSLVLPAALLGVLAWGVALGFGLWLRSLDTHRREAMDAVRRDERLALARELHDVVAHHVAAIVVRTQAARLAAARNPQQLDECLGEIESAGGQALIAMRQVVGLLRAGITT